jgi:hypothetical protein
MDLSTLSDLTELDRNQHYAHADLRRNKFALPNDD